MSIAAAVLDACKRAVSKNRSLDNINLDCVVSGALQRLEVTDDTVEVFPGATVSEIWTLQMQDIVGDYDDPDTVPEWVWLAKQASFSHRDNGQDGVLEYVLNLALHLDDIPKRLEPVIAAARQSCIAFIIFHQGT